MELLPRDFETNYRELEDILTKAIVFTKIGDRETITHKELKRAIAQYEKFLKYTKTESKEDAMAPENLNLKDIFDYVSKIRASIIETKIKSQMQRTGEDLKSICDSEGIQYHNFRKRVVSITGKGIKELVT